MSLYDALVRLYVPLAVVVVGIPAMAGLLNGDTAAMVWVLASGIGAAFAFAGAVEAQKDLHALKGYTNGRRINARRDRRNQTIRCTVQTAWFVYGVPLAFDERIIGWSLAVGMLVVSTSAFAVLAALDLRDRRALMARVS